MPYLAKFVFIAFLLLVLKVIANTQVKPKGAAKQRKCLFCYLKCAL